MVNYFAAISITSIHTHMESILDLASKRRLKHQTRIYRQIVPGVEHDQHPFRTARPFRRNSGLPRWTSCCQWRRTWAKAPEGPTNVTNDNPHEASMNPGSAGNSIPLWHIFVSGTRQTMTKVTQVFQEISSLDALGVPGTAHHQGDQGTGIGTFTPTWQGATSKHFQRSACLEWKNMENETNCTSMKKYRWLKRLDAIVRNCLIPKQRLRIFLALMRLPPFGCDSSLTRTLPFPHETFLLFQ